MKQSSKFLIAGILSIAASLVFGVFFNDQFTSAVFTILGMACLASTAILDNLEAKIEKKKPSRENYLEDLITESKFRLSRHQADIFRSVVQGDIQMIALIGGVRTGKTFLANYIHDNYSKDVQIHEAQSDNYAEIRTLESLGYTRFYLDTKRPIPGRWYMQNGAPHGRPAGEHIYFKFNGRYGGGSQKGINFIGEWSTSIGAYEHESHEFQPVHSDTVIQKIREYATRVGWCEDYTKEFISKNV